jgi:hypothetical protein
MYSGSAAGAGSDGTATAASSQEFAANDFVQPND